MNEKSLIVGILTCPKYKRRMQAVRETWLKALPPEITVLFLLGDQGSPSRIEGDVLYLNCPEGYEFIPAKTYFFAEFCLRNFQFQYLFKADDDTYVNVPQFLKFKKRGDYIGRFTGGPGNKIDRTWHYGKYSRPELEKPFAGEFIAPWAAGGDGYFLSRKAANYLIESGRSVIESELLDPFYCGYEDMLVGNILSQSSDLVRQDSDIGEFGTIHPATPTAMRAIHYNLASNSPDPR
jgi:hypothetical protein